MRHLRLEGDADDLKTIVGGNRLNRRARSEIEEHNRPIGSNETNRA